MQKFSKHSLLILTGILMLQSAQAVYAEAFNRAAKVFTVSEAEKLLGGPVKAGSENSSFDNENGKSWQSKASYALLTKTGSAPQLTLAIHHFTTVKEAAASFKKDKITLHGEDIAGLAAPAFRAALPPQMHVLKGLNWLIIGAGTFAKPDLPAQTKLAELILTKISKENVLENTSLKGQSITSAKNASTKRGSVTAAQAVALIKKRNDVEKFLALFPAGHSKKTDGIPVVEAEDDGANWNVHVFEQMSDHTATMNWYVVNKKTGMIKVLIP